MGSVTTTAVKRQLCAAMPVGFAAAPPQKLCAVQHSGSRDSRAQPPNRHPPDSEFCSAAAPHQSRAKSHTAMQQSSPGRAWETFGPQKTLRHIDHSAALTAGGRRGAMTSFVRPAHKRVARGRRGRRAHGRPPPSGRSRSALTTVFRGAPALVRGPRGPLVLHGSRTRSMGWGTARSPLP